MIPPATPAHRSPSRVARVSEWSVGQRWRTLQRMQRCTAAVAASVAAALALAACGRGADEGPIAMLVTPEAAIAAAGQLQQVVERLQAQPETPSEQEFRDAVSEWRTEAERALDGSFGAVIGRAEVDGVPFAMRPVVGERFAVRVLFLNDGSFVAAAQHDERGAPSNLLFRCRLSASEVVGAASITSMQFVARLTEEVAVPVRLYVGGGFTMPTRAAEASTDLLGACLGHLTSRRAGAFGEEQQRYVQSTHDFFFEVDRSQ